MANTWVHENDTESLERLARYGARGPIALKGLSRREDGKLEYQLKKPAHGGATTLVLAEPPAPDTATASPAEGTPRAHPPRPRLDWAQLLRRTWGFDVFDCPCGARRRVVALDVARKILGLPSRPRTRPLPTGAPQLPLPLH